MIRILIVEDSPTVLVTIGNQLVEAGYEVIGAADGEQAIQMAVDERPSLILLDVILPKLNGYQVCRKLKSQAETRTIPVVMITSKAKEADRRWGMEQGADAYIAKPIDIDELLTSIRSLLPEVG